MDRIGKLVVCDRCGMSTFRPDAGCFYEIANGWTTFTPPEKAGSIDLCPSCSRDLKGTIDQYMDQHNNICVGMIVRHDSYCDACDAEGKNDQT